MRTGPHPLSFHLREPSIVRISSQMITAFRQSSNILSHRMRPETTVASRGHRAGVSFRQAITMILAGGLTCGAAFAAPPAQESFFNAVRAGDSSAVRALLKAGADVHGRDALG